VKVQESGFLTQLVAYVHPQPQPEGKEASVDFKEGCLRVVSCLLDLPMNKLAMEVVLTPFNAI